jgi:DNA-3-methyladenine glycosylase II
MAPAFCLSRAGTGLRWAAVGLVGNFQLEPKGPFDLLFQNRYFNGWPPLAADPTTIVMAFPVEGWGAPAAVTLAQSPDGAIVGKVYGDPSIDITRAQSQAIAAMSLDADGSRWPDVGKHDPVLGALQADYHFMRPTLFHSAYEAAAAFVIGHRISVRQTRALRQRLAEEHGKALVVEGETFYAFPEPQALLALDDLRSLNDIKVQRLHAVCEAALDGWLEREHLKALADGEALAKLMTLPGIGAFFAQAILYRGVGVVDSVTSDDLTFEAVEAAYDLAAPVTRSDVLRVAENWRPYRMWAVVLLHVWLRSAGQPPERQAKP